MRSLLFKVLNLILFFAMMMSLSCASSLAMGRRFGDSWIKVKEGYHTERDVLRLMGSPQREVIDPKGRKIFVYYWADGYGNGQECVIVFNRKGEVMLKEVVE